MRSCRQRHGDPLRALPEWTVWRLFFKRVGAVGAAFRGAFRAAFPPAVSTVPSQPGWCFEQCRLVVKNRLSLPLDARFRRIQQAFDAPRYRVLYRRWLEDGDAALDAIGSGAIAEKLERGAGRLECVVLPHSYRHLTPLVSRRSTSQGVEEGAARGTRFRSDRVFARHSKTSPLKPTRMTCPGRRDTRGRFLRTRH